MTANPPDLENVPEFLKPFQNWVLWIWGSTKKGKPTKIPICPHRNEYGQFYWAAINNPLNWGSFDQVSKLCRDFEGKKLPGVGITLGGAGFVNQGQVFCLDFDNVTKANGQGIPGETWAMIRTANTYTECTPSGTGIRMLCQIPETLGRCFIPKTRIDWSGLTEAEAWTHGKFFTVTGWIAGEDYKEVRRNDEFVAKVLSVLEGKNGHAHPTPVSDPGTAGGIIASRPHAHGPSVDAVRDIVGRVSARIPHDDWVRAGMAIHAWDPGEAGNRLWHEWSATAPDLYDRDEAETKWRSFKTEGNGQGQVSLGTLHHMAEGFPVDVFPDAVRRVIEETHRVAGTPYPLSGAIALALVSASIGKGLVVHNVKAGRDGLPTLHFCIFAPSGSGKTITYEQIMKPWKNWTRGREDEFQRMTRPGILARIGALNERIRRNEREFGKKRNDDLVMENAKLRIELESLERSKLGTRYETEDVTAECLARLASRNREAGQEALFCVSDDANQALGTLLGRYSEGDPTDTLYNKGWSWGGHIQDRQDGERSAQVRELALTMLWLMQPDLADRMVGNDRLMNSGFMQRQLLDLIEFPRGEETEERTFSQEIAGEWDLLVQMVLAKFRQARETAKIETEPGVRELMRAYANENARRTYDGQDLADVQTHVSRWRELAWRLALTLHVMRHRDDAGGIPLALADAEGGIRLARYYAHRKLRLLYAGRMQARENLKRSVDQLVEKLGGKITPSRLSQYKHATFPTASRARDYLEQRVGQGDYVREEIQPEPGAGGKTSVVYSIKPKEKTDTHNQEEPAKEAGDCSDRSGRSRGVA